MNYPNRSADTRGRSYAVVAENRSHHSRRLNKQARSTSRVSSYQSHTLAKPQPESLEWEAIQEIFLASRPRFVGLAYSILRNKEDAEDAVQDALLSAYRHLRGFEGRSAFRTWFTRVVMNAALMIRRKRRRSRIDAPPEFPVADETSWMERIPASQPDPEMLCAEAETFRRVDIELGKMTPILRQAFTMTYYDEMSNQEAGAMLGVTTGTLKSRLVRARRHLKKQAQRSVVAPIRKPGHSACSFGEGAFQNLASRPAEISSPEIAFS